MEEILFHEKRRQMELFGPLLNDLFPPSVEFPFRGGGPDHLCGDSMV